MTKYFCLLLFFSICFTACQKTYELVEIKNEDGQLAKSFQIDQDSVKQDWEYSFDAEGNKMDQSYYIDGALDSLRTIFFGDGTVEIEERYQAGKLHGIYKSYHENGQLKFEAKYNRDVLNGLAKSYYPSGNLKEEVTFKHNEENGPFTEYFENGNPMWEGQYINGDNEIGELRQFNDEGKLIKKLFCDSLHVCQTFWTLEDGDIEIKNIHGDK